MIRTRRHGINHIHVHILISSEKQQHNPGWQERIKSLQDIKQQATIVTSMAKLEVKSKSIMITSTCRTVNGCMEDII